MQTEYDLAKARFVLAKIIQDLVPVRSTDKEAKVNSNMRDIATIIEDDIIGTVNRPLIRGDLNVIQISVLGG